MSSPHLLARLPPDQGLTHQVRKSSPVTVRPANNFWELKTESGSLWAHAGWNNRVEYEPGTGALTLFPNVHLETCDESVASAQVVVELETSHIGMACPPGLRPLGSAGPAVHSRGRAGRERHGA